MAVMDEFKEERAKVKEIPAIAMMAINTVIIIATL